MDKNLYFISMDMFSLYSEYRFVSNLIGRHFETKQVKITPIGMIIIDSGYYWTRIPWTLHTRDVIKASLILSALYDLIQSGAKIQKNEADLAVLNILLSEGMNAIRAEFIYMYISGLYTVNDPRRSILIRKA